MQSTAITPKEYLKNFPEDRKKAVSKLRNTVKKNLPKGFKEVIGYGMLGYVVPHSIYPEGYHCNPKLPLPFINIASQKNSISLHHMGLYNNELLKWFTTNWKKVTQKKLDLGKCCIRFKNEKDIPWDLIGDLVKKISVNDWIAIYESQLKRK